MFCHKCGKKLPDGLKFCTACGTKLMTPATPAPQQKPTPVAAPAPVVKPVEVAPAPVREPVQPKAEAPVREAAPQPKPVEAKPAPVPVEEKTTPPTFASQTPPPLTRGGAEPVSKPAEKKKKSPLKGVLIALLCLVFLGVGVGGTLYFTGFFDKDSAGDVSVSDRNENKTDRNENKNQNAGGNTAPDTQPGDTNSSTDAAPEETPDAPAVEDVPAMEETPAVEEEEPVEEEPVQVVDNPQATVETTLAYFAGVMQMGDWVSVMNTTTADEYFEYYDHGRMAENAQRNPNQALLLETSLDPMLRSYLLCGEMASQLMVFFGNLAAPELGLDEVPEGYFDSMSVSEDEANLYAEALSAFVPGDMNFLGGALITKESGSRDLGELAASLGAEDYAEALLFVEYHGMSRAMGLTLLCYGGEWNVFELCCADNFIEAGGVASPDDPDDALMFIGEAYGLDLQFFELPQVNLPTDMGVLGLHEPFAQSCDEAFFVMYECLMAGDGYMVFGAMDTVPLTCISASNYVERNGCYETTDCFRVEGELASLNRFRALCQNAEELKDLRDFLLSPMSDLAYKRFYKEYNNTGSDPQAEYEQYRELAKCVYDTQLLDLWFIEFPEQAHRYEAENLVVGIALLELMDEYYILDVTLLEYDLDGERYWFVADFGLDTTSTHLDAASYEEAYELYAIHADEIGNQ